MSTTIYRVKMATTGVGFRWLDILEKEFDKACVELDTSIMDLETEDPEVVFTARQKIATLSSCFAQLTHKALTIFQNSAKLEAELVDMRAELVQARAAGGKDEGDTMGTVSEAARARSEAAQLTRENAALRETILALHSELFGARLATKYLDKELAGRIQQLQLLGRDMRSELRDSLWAQVEAEILLQRHKTLVRVCRGLSPRPPRPPHAARSRPRTVRVRRSPHLGLGISVTGGREHGVPILISELEAGGPAALTGQLYVGDAILAINDCDLTQACHKEAVQALQSVKGDCALCVQFIATDDDDRMSEDNYRFPLYPEDEPYGEEADGSGATPTAPRTPEYNHRRGSVSESYADYSTVRNNLAILDMDDDSIKIEARLEMAPVSCAGGVSAVSVGSPYSSASPVSTPVHAPRSAIKKKRKPQDWRTKGAYCAVSPDAPSSDEPPDATHDKTHEATGDTMRDATNDMTCDSRDTTRDVIYDMTPDVTHNTLNKPQYTFNNNVDKVVILDNSTDSPASQSLATPAVKVKAVDEVPVAPLIVMSDEQTRAKVIAQEESAPVTAHEKVNHTVKPVNLNGETRLRRETKGFRIGSARRVTEMSVRNGDVSARDAPPHPASRLLPGHGDPDFGTPV